MLLLPVVVLLLMLLLLSVLVLLVLSALVLRFLLGDTGARAAAGTGANAIALDPGAMTLLLPELMTVLMHFVHVFDFFLANQTQKYERETAAVQTKIPETFHGRNTQNKRGPRGLASGIQLCTNQLANRAQTNSKPDARASKYPKPRSKWLRVRTGGGAAASRGIKSTPHHTARSRKQKTRSGFGLGRAGMLIACR